MTAKSYIVTLYSMYFGDRDIITGQYDLGFGSYQIKIIIFGESGPTNAVGPAIYSRHNATGYTNYQVNHGDVIKDPFDRYYLIAAEPVPVVDGNEHIYYKVSLEQLDDFPFTVSNYYGFEEIDADHKFEDGFERGYWVYS